MDLSILKDLGVTGWPVVIVFVALFFGDKILAIFRTKIEQKPAMAAAKLSAQQQADVTTAALIKSLMERLTAAEARLDQKDKDMMAMAEEMRACEHRYSILCQILAKHDIPIPAELTT